MVNVNKTKESIQNVLIFITDAIALIMSYYMSGFIWLMEIRNNTFSYVMKVLNGNIVTIIIAVLIAALFCNIKGDVLNRGKFEELASVMKKSLISSAVIAVYELLSKTAQGVPRSVYVITFFMGTVLMFLLRMLVKVYMKHRHGGQMQLKNHICNEARYHMHQIICRGTLISLLLEKHNKQVNQQ